MFLVPNFTHITYFVTYTYCRFSSLNIVFHMLRHVYTLLFYITRINTLKLYNFSIHLSALFERKTNFFNKMHTVKVSFLKQCYD